MCSGEYRLGAVGALTESTATVPVETWVIETDAVGVGFTDLSGTSRNRESLIGGSLLIGGVAENLDLQFGFDGWLSSEQRTDLATDRVTGIGDTWLRFKWNFAGNEVSGAAWSTLPYIKIPSGDSGVSNGIWEPGIALIYGQPFGDAGILNATFAVDSVQGDFGSREELFAWSFSYRHHSGWFGELGGEYVADSPGPAPAVVAVGYAHELTPSLVGEIECYAGLNRATEDFRIVIRVIWEVPFLQ